MAKRKSRSWNPPAQGTRKRAEMSRSSFLDPVHRRYPFKEKIGGRMRVSERGLMAAFKRARQQGDLAIAKKAATRLNRIRKRKGKEPVGQD